MSTLKAIDQETFAAAVEQAAGVVAVDFWAEWCPPCRLSKPILEKVAAELAGRLSVLSLDSDANPSAAARYGVRHLPTVLVFRDGEVVDRIVGLVPEEVLRERLARLVG